MMKEFHIKNANTRCVSQVSLHIPVTSDTMNLHSCHPNLCEDDNIRLPFAVTFSGLRDFPILCFDLFSSERETNTMTKRSNRQTYY